MQFILSVIKSIWDNIEKFSQLGLLILALIGYFYTVVPVYQKELLTEQISQKELDLTNKTNDLKKIQESFIQIQNSLQENEKIINNQQKLIAKVTNEINHLEKNRINLEKKVEENYQNFRNESIYNFLTFWVIRNTMELDTNTNLAYLDLPKKFPEGLKEADKKMLMQFILDEQNATRKQIDNLNKEINDFKKLKKEEIINCNGDTDIKKCKYNAEIKEIENLTFIKLEYSKMYSSSRDNILKKLNISK